MGAGEIKCSKGRLIRRHKKVTWLCKETRICGTCVFVASGGGGRELGWPTYQTRISLYLTTGQLNETGLAFFAVVLVTDVLLESHARLTCGLSFNLSSQSLSSV
jgi:hypothetical protein